MRVLTAAWDDDAVDADSACWLVSQVLDYGSPESKHEAAGLLLGYANKLTGSETPGSYSWPDALHGRWCSGLSLNGAMLLILALIELVTSQDKEWWREQYTWVSHALDEAILNDPNNEVKRFAATISLALLRVTDLDEISGIEDAPTKANPDGARRELL